VVIIVVDVVDIIGVVVVAIVVVLIIMQQLLLFYRYSLGFPVPQVPRSQSQRAPPEECTMESRVAGLAEAAHSLVPTVQLACVRCSCRLRGEDEPSKI
jgi:hypothetical protein